ncbi:MAG: hypothetical protein NTY91_00840, partial [Euryarchaeota archaeon]|nr:hypothetical protein [Euryarchaeota archaeon]
MANFIHHDIEGNPCFHINFTVKRRVNNIDQASTRFMLCKKTKNSCFYARLIDSECYTYSTTHEPKTIWFIINITSKQQF